MTPRTIDARAAARLVKEKGALLVDIREPPEHARENIPGAISVPLSMLDRHDFRRDGAPVIFHCQGGNRTCANEARLAVCGAADVYLLGGGIAGWKGAGLPTALDRTQPIEMQRQVQIAAGSLVLIGLLLAASVSAWFAALSAFVGAGLVFAGISGWCGMAKILAVMPWNRVSKPGAA